MAMRPALIAKDSSLSADLLCMNLWYLSVKLIFLCFATIVLCLLIQGFAYSQYKSAPDDHVIQNIIRLHQAPEEVMRELKEILKSNPDPLTKAETYYLLSIGFNKLNKNTESIEAIAKANSLLADLDEPLLAHRVMLSKVQILLRTGKAEEALPLAQKVIDWAKLNGIRQLYIGGLINSGVLNTSLNYYDRALEHFQLAYDQATTYKTKISPSHVASLIANVHLARGDADLAISFYNEALEYARSKGNKLVQKGLLYKIGEAYKQKGDFEQALVYSMESLGLSIKLSDQGGIAAGRIQNAKIYHEMGQIEEAIKSYENALENLSLNNNPFQQFEVNYGLARAFLSTRDLKAADDFLQRARHFVAGEAMEQQNILAEELMAELLFLQGKSGEAYLMLKLNIARKADLLTKQNEKQVLLLKTQFETIKKEKENNELRRVNSMQKMEISAQRIRQFSVFVVLLALLFIIILMFIINVKSRKYRRHLENILNYDSLTGLFSRKYIIDYAKCAIERAKKSGEVLSIAVIDIDFFKKINDNFGHPVGDQLLKQFGELGLRAFSENIKLGRIGGEEFLFVFSKLDSNAALEVLNSFREEVKLLPPKLKLKDLSFSISAGLVENDKQATVSSLLFQADQALYQAKNDGRDRIVVYQN